MESQVKCLYKSIDDYVSNHENITLLGDFNIYWVIQWKRFVKLANSIALLKKLRQKPRESIIYWFNFDKQTPMFSTVQVFVCFTAWNYKLRAFLYENDLGASSKSCIEVLEKHASRKKRYLQANHIRFIDYEISKEVALMAMLF